jgi:hypothetical protein
LYRLALVVALSCFANLVLADGCNRDWFYKSWPVENRMDLRQVLLLERAIGDSIVYETANGRKRVGRGTWVDELTGVYYRDVNPSEFVEDKRDLNSKLGIEVSAELLHIDHIIPLQWACRHGASEWSAQKRRDFATDEYLLAITNSSENLSKGDQGAETWQPAKAEIACWYNKTFIYGIHSYEMDVEAAVFLQILNNMESTCRAAANN